MASPIEHVMIHVPAAIERVAPERGPRLAELRAQIAFEFTASPTFACRYFIETRTIRFSAGALSLLWACAHAYVTLYDRVLPLWINGKGQLDLTTDPRVRDAMTLLSWAMDALLGKRTTDPWPEGLLVPVANPGKGSDENVADELALTAAAFLLHHELAHHYLNHTPRVDHSENIQEEKDADAEAANWILGAEVRGSAAFFKRALGISTSLLVLLARAIHRRRFSGTTHPREFDRLVHVLDRHVPPEHRLWQFVALALKLHLDAAGIKTPDVPHESARACLELYVEQLAQAEVKWSRE